MTKPQTTIARLLATALLPAALGGALGCDPVEDHEDRIFEDDALDDLDLDEEAEAEAEAEADPSTAPERTVAERPALPPPPAADPDSAPSQQLTQDSAPVGAYGWGSWVSEETPPSTCDAGTIVTAFDSYGSYSDEVQLYCQSHGNSGGSGSRTWSSFFSEEGQSHRYCADGSFVSGVACNGWWCDNVSIECTDIGVTHTSCVWSGWHAANDPWFVAPTGNAVAGVQCSGAYCDELRFYYCAI